MAILLEWVANYDNTAVTAKKTTEFGSALQCPFGCSSGNQGSKVTGTPFGGVIFTTDPGSFNVIKGQAKFFLFNESDGSGYIDWIPDPSENWNFYNDQFDGQWHCWSFHITDAYTGN